MPVGHMWGDDAHTSWLIGIAKAIAEHKPDVRVKFEQLGACLWSITYREDL